MAITDYKITEQQIAEKGVVAAPDMLTGTAQENKGVFDRLVRETVAPAFNSVLDALADENEQRNADEATRKAQETARVAAEELRVAAENGRVAAETERETAERQRADETAGIVAQATRQAAAAEAAKTAAEDAREETIGHKNAAYWYAQDAAASKNAAAESATAAGQQAGSASGFAARAEEALSKMGVHIGADTPANGAKLWLYPVNNPMVMNPDRATSDMTQEVGVNDDGKLVTTVEDGSISESKLAQDVKDKFRSLSEEIANLGGGSGGTAATLEITSIEMLPTDSAPEVVENEGSTAQARSYTLKMPQGPQGEKGDTGPKGQQGEPGPTGLGVPTPTADDAGKVPAVNAAGDGYELVEMSAGGGATDREWTLLGTVDCSVASGNIEFTDLDDFTEFWILWDTVKNASDTVSQYALTINDIMISSFIVPVCNQSKSTPDYGHSHITFDGFIWEARRSAGSTATNNFSMSGSNALYPYNIVQNVGSAKVIKILSPIAVYQAVSGTIEIWGR